MTDHDGRTAAMTAGRRADTARRHQRVTTALAQTSDAGDDITVAAIARRAGVDRSFVYRHPDLLADIHTAQTQPANATGPTTSRASLQADLAAAQARSQRQLARIRQLESRLSELLGEQTWRATGLGDPIDIDELKQRITHLDQHTIDLQLRLDERTQELDAARATNRALMIQLNTVAD